MKSHLPYPGKYESFASWDWRCKQWESYRNRSRSRGLSGRPNKSGVEGGKDGTHETWVKIAGQYATVRVPMLGEVDGRKVRILKRAYGRRETQRVRLFAERNGLEFRAFAGNKCKGKCYRQDGMAFRFID